MRPFHRMRWGFAVIACAACLMSIAVACRQQQTNAKRYHLQGQIVSINAPAKIVILSHGEIPGLMPAMTMSYSVKDAKDLEGLAAGDTIKADLVLHDGLGHLEHLQKVAALPPENIKDPQGPPK